MPDERIVLVYDEKDALESSARANKAIESNEKAAERAGAAITKATDAQSAAILRITERSRASINRTVEAVRQKAALAEADTPLKRLQLDRSRDLSRVAGDPRAVEAVTSAYARLETRARAALGNVVQSGRAAESQVAKLVKSFESAGNAFSTIGSRLTVGLSAPLAAGAAAATYLFGKLEQARIGFTTMLGSAEKADAFLRKLADFASRTPFEFRELVPMAQRLRALGFQAQEVIPIIGAVGGAVAALGGGSELIDRITLALGQMQAKGKVSHEEVRQLAEAGIPVWETLAARIGVTIPQAMKMAEQGAIRSSVAIPAILDDMVKRFGGLLEKQNQTTLGQFSNLKDKLGFLAADVGRVLDPVAASMLRFASSAVGSLRGLVQEFALLPSSVQKGTIAILGLVAVAGPAASAIGALSRALAFLYGAQFAGVVANLGSLGIAVRGVAGYATGAIGPLTKLGSWLLRVGQLAAFVGAAFAGWKLGSWIRDLAGLNEAEKAAESMQKLAEAEKEFVATKLFERLKARGLLMKRDGQSLEDWTAQMRSAAEQLAVIDAMAKRAGEGTATASKEILAAEKRAHEFRKQTQVSTLEGLDEIAERRRQLLAEVGKTPRARADIEAGIAAQTQQFFDKFEKQFSDFQAKFEARSSDVRKKAVVDELAFAEEKNRAILEAESQVARELDDIALTGLDARKAAELRTLDLHRAQVLRLGDSQGRQALQQTLAIERQKSEIEEKYILERFALEAEVLRKRAELVELLESDDGVRNAKLQALAAEAQRISAITQAQVDDLRGQTIIRQTEMIRDQNQRIFDDIYRQAESVIDRLLDDWRSAGDVIKGILKAAILTPIKRAGAELIAGLLAPMYGGGAGGGGGPASSGGFFGRILGGGILGGGLFGQAGAPGGTPGFAGPVGGFGGLQGGTAGASSLGGPASGLAGLASFAGGPLGFLRQLGGLGGGGVQMTNLPIGGSVITSAGKGIGGAAGGGLLLGGGALAYAGLRRGGLSGLAMTTAGGALIGAKFGGPLGAAIGAGIGAAAGTIRLFIKGAEQKIIDKIQALYGIRIDRSFARDPLLPMIKNQFGGNIDVGIRSQEIKDLIELYGMSTGQGTGPLTSRPRPLVFSDVGGRLTEQPGYWNGAPLLSGSLNSAASGARIEPQPAPQIGTVQLIVDGQSAAALLDGRIAPVVAKSPAAVAEATTDAQRLSYNRQKNLVGQFGYITA